MASVPTEPEAMNGDATLQLPWDATNTDPAIETESSDTVDRLPGLERIHAVAAAAATTTTAADPLRDHPVLTGHRPQQTPLPVPTGPLLLAPTPLIRSASAPPDYLPSLPASRQHRAMRGPMHIPSDDDDDDDFRAFPMPPEVVETGRREKECSACCLRCIVVMTTLRWLFVSAALLGAACVITGIVFGVMSSTLIMSPFFILAFTFIGLGIVLVLVVGIGWRCSPVGHEPCHALFHLTANTSGGDGPISYHAGTQRAPRLMQRSRNQWYGGFLYPEFRYVTPPPSYSTSVQQYSQRTVQQQGPATGDRNFLGNSSINSLDNLSSLPNSPPPTYQSRGVGRIRPPLCGIMVLANTISDELPPSYHSSSTASSLARLADVDEDPDPGVSPPGFTTPVTVEPTIGFDHSQVSEPSSNPQVGGVAADLLDTPIANGTNQTEVTMRASFSLVPEDVPEALPSVRSIVQRFEDLAKATSTKDLSEKTGQLYSANSNHFSSCNHSGSIDATDLTADQIFDDEGQLPIKQRSVKQFPADQLHSRNRADDEDLCSANQLPNTSSNINQSNVTINSEGSCSFGHSSNAEFVDDQSHSRFSISDVDSCSVYQLTDGHPTDNHSQTRSTVSANSTGFVSQAPSGNVTTDAYSVSQSQSEATAAYCFSCQSRNSGHIQILQPANSCQVSSSSNQSYHDFSRSQSLDDHEIGESGI